MKVQLIKRIEEAERKAARRQEDELDKIFSKMTIAELHECEDENLSEERFQAMLREVAKR